MSSTSCASMECDEDLVHGAADAAGKPAADKAATAAAAASGKRKAQEASKSGQKKPKTDAARPKSEGKQTEAAESKPKSEAKKNEATNKKKAQDKKEKDKDDPRLPVIVLTGFLGSGKTTLINRILTEMHGNRIAIIENEFGEVGVDNELVIQQNEELVEMNNGCICCTVRGDLIKILEKLWAKRASLDYILIETTGLADPSPVAQTFFVEEKVAERYRLDGIITVVDCYHISKALEETKEAKEQIAFADVILLNKCDLVESKQVDTLETKIHKMNAAAKIFRTTKSVGVDVSRLLDIGGFNVRRALDVDPEFFTPEHPCEWAGCYDLKKGAYKLVLDKGPDETMTIVFMHKLSDKKGGAKKAASSAAEIKESKDALAVALTKVKAEVTGEAAADASPAEAALMKASRSAMLAFSSRDTVREIAAGGKLSASKQTAVLRMNNKACEFILQVTDAGVHLLFTEHQPSEYSMRIEEVPEAADGKTRSAVVKPVFERAFKPDHEHSDEVSSVGLTLDEALDSEKLNAWLSYTLQNRGEDIFRMKGVFNIKGWQKRYVFHGVHMLFNGTADRDWKAGEQRKSTLVFIGRKLDRAELQKSFFACAAKQ